jgi:hypothetical protein
MAYVSIKLELDVYFMFLKKKFFGDTLTSNNISYEVTSGFNLGVMSCNHSFIFDRPTICKTVKHIDQSDNSSWHVLCYDIPNDLVGSLLIGQYEP